MSRRRTESRQPRRIEYAGSVHDEREIEAVLAVLRGGATALRIGRNVRELEARVAALFGKRRGIMCTRARRRSISRSSCSGSRPVTRS